MDEPIYWGFAVLELSKLLMYETYCYNLQTFFRGRNNQNNSFDTDAFVLGFMSKDNTKDLKHLEDLYDFCNLCEKNWLFQ